MVIELRRAGWSYKSNQMTYGCVSRQEQSHFLLSNDSHRVRVWHRHGAGSNSALYMERPTTQQRGLKYHCARWQITCCSYSEVYDSSMIIGLSTAVCDTPYPSEGTQYRLLMNKAL
ncbi:hypothetical protein TNCV_1453641 [Trichonephila clavipes]|nr:hypothetical protein TNCV_1453641 [Trichonephila clavipes]